jgi:transglutaminase-like putative cysteine protease
MEQYLQETSFLNFNDRSFDSFTEGIDGSKSAKEVAIDLYFLVRDKFTYDPYHLDLRIEGLTCSNVISKRRSWCVEKSALLAACCRRFSIPARLGYAIVTNHIGVEKLTSYLRREEIVFHGYTEIYLNEKWVKCTPSFDKNICRMMNVAPLDWDGESDSMFQEFEKGEKYMEYKHFYGEFADIPIELMNSEMKKYYPHLFEEEFVSKQFSFYHM